MASEGTNRIAKNTVFLYIRQAVSMIISFATVSVTLDVLGETDYGINNVVAGAVSMFNFLVGAMSVGNQRFYSFYLGKQDFSRLKKIVGGTLGIYIIIAILLLILGETVGLWFLNNKLVIPHERIDAANWLFQFGLISLCIGMLNPPFTALIMAHEDMSFYAKISIWEAIVRLATVFLLWLLPFDKLIALGAITFTIARLTQFIYLRYCWKHYPECHIKPVYEKDVIKELLGFNVWNLCGNFAWMIKNQGTSFILNMFFGPAVNAAHAVATGIQSNSTILTSSFQASVSPQVTKSYASENKEHMFKLAFSGSKMVFLLMSVVIIPLIFNIELVLDIWLPHTPEHTAVFCQIMLVEILLEQTSGLVATIQQATGKIRNYQLLIGFFGCLNLPISYIALKLGAAPEWVFVISLAMQLCVIAVRVLFLKRVDPSSRSRYMFKTAFPCLFAGVVAAGICFVIPRSSSLLIQIPIIILQVLITAACIFFLAFDKNERILGLGYISSIKSKLLRKYYEDQ